MAQQFLASITLQNGLVLHGLFSPILPSDLPDSPVAPGGYANPRLLTVDRAGRVIGVTAGNADSNYAYTDVANAFTAAPQTFHADADDRSAVVLNRHSATQTADVLQYQNEAGVPLIGLSTWGSVRVYDSLTMSGFMAGTFTGLADGATYGDCEFAVNMELRAGAWNLINTSLWGAFNQLDCSAANGDVQFYLAPPQSNPAGTFYLVGYVSGQDRGIGANVDTAPTNAYRTFGALTAYCYTSTQVGLWVTGAASQTAPLAQLRGVDAANVERHLANVDASFADPTSATFRGQLDLGAWDAGGGTPALRPGIRLTSDGAECIGTVTGKVFQNTPGRARVTADATNATNAFASLADLTLTLVGGRMYAGRLVLKCVNSTAAEGVKFDFNGGTATMTGFWAGGGVLASGGTDVVGTNISTSLAGVINFTTFTGESIVVIELSLVVNAGGTFIPRFAENAAHVTGTATVRLGSFLWLEDSPN